MRELNGFKIEEISVFHIAVDLIKNLWVIVMVALSVWIGMGSAAEILHSSYIAWKGKGIVFSAPSGTGKSTQAELWRKHRPGTEIINGDRSILTCERGIPEVYGLPLCGSSEIAVNKRFPLGAVVVLRQAKTNTVRRLGVREAVSLIYSECGLSLWDRDAAANVLDVVSEIAESVPVYCLSCLPHSSAVDAMERALREDFYDV